MARFKKFRKMSRRAYSSMRKGYSRSRKPSMSAMDVLLAGAIYGVARPMVANAIPTMFSFGPVDSDNVILGGAGYMASKNRNKLIKSIGLIAMGTEAGIIASKVVAGNTNSSSTGFNW